MLGENVLSDVVVRRRADPALLFVLRVRLTVEEVRLVAEENLAAFGTRAWVEFALLLLLVDRRRVVAERSLLAGREQIGGCTVRRVTRR